MPRKLRDASLATREARLRLKPASKPHWRLLEAGRHLGYYKGQRGGSWVARTFAGDHYIQIKLGLADDTSDADGRRFLNFAQAQEKAREWCASQARIRDGHAPITQSQYYVENAIVDYLSEHYSSSGRARKAIVTQINAHIHPAFGKIEISKLTTTRIRTWHMDLAASPARRRTKALASRRNIADKPKDIESVRRRRATANNVLTILKAILNHAWREQRVLDDSAWRRVKPFPKVNAPVIRYLSISESVRLVKVCQSDLQQIVRAALLTGCRYGEITRLQTCDYNADSGTLTVRESKSGKPRHVVLTDEGKGFFNALTSNKSSEEILFKRTSGSMWNKSQQHRPLKAACKIANILPAISFHVLRHTYASTLAMAGVPLAVIAEQLGHADTRITQRHYAHLSPSYIADTIRQSFPTLGIIPPQAN